MTDELNNQYQTRTRENNKKENQKRIVKGRKRLRSSLSPEPLDSPHNNNGKFFLFSLQVYFFQKKIENFKKCLHWMI